MTILANDKNETMATRENGGAGTTFVDVAMPRSVATMVSSMPVHEQSSPDLHTTLGQWIEDQKAAGHFIRYSGEFVRL